jgi:hypothetical protein
MIYIQSVHLSIRLYAKLDFKFIHWIRSKFLLSSISFTAGIEASVANDRAILQHDRSIRAFDASFLSFLDGVLNIDASVVSNLQVANAKLKSTGGALCRGYEQHALEHNEAALAKSVKLSSELAHSAKSLLEIPNQKAHSSKTQEHSLLCQHRQLLQENLEREHRAVEVADATSNRIALVSESQRTRSNMANELSQAAQALQDRFANIRNVDMQRFGVEDVSIGEVASALTELSTILKESSKSLASTNSHQMRNFLRQSRQIRSQMSHGTIFLQGLTDLCDNTDLAKDVRIPKISYQLDALETRLPTKTVRETRTAKPVYHAASKGTRKPLAEHVHQNKSDGTTDADLLRQRIEIQRIIQSPQHFSTESSNLSI